MFVDRGIYYFCAYGQRRFNVKYFFIGKGEDEFGSKKGDAWMPEVRKPNQVLSAIWLRYWLLRAREVYILPGFDPTELLESLLYFMMVPKGVIAGCTDWHALWSVAQGYSSRLGGHPIPITVLESYPTELRPGSFGLSVTPGRFEGVRMEFDETVEYQKGQVRPFKLVPYTNSGFALSSFIPKPEPVSTTVIQPSDADVPTTQATSSIL